MTQRMWMFLWSFLVSLFSIYAVLRLELAWLLNGAESLNRLDPHGPIMTLLRMVDDPLLWLLVQPIVLFVLHVCLHWLIYTRRVDRQWERKLSMRLLLPRKGRPASHIFRILLYAGLTGLLFFAVSNDAPVPSSVIVMLTLLHYGWWLLDCLDHPPGKATALTNKAAD